MTNSKGTSREDGAKMLHRSSMDEKRYLEINDISCLILFVKVNIVIYSGQ